MMKLRYCKLKLNYNVQILFQKWYHALKTFKGEMTHFFSICYILHVHERVTIHNKLLLVRSSCKLSLTHLHSRISFASRTKDELSSGFVQQNCHCENISYRLYILVMNKRLENVQQYCKKTHHFYFVRYESTLPLLQNTTESK